MAEILELINNTIDLFNIKRNKKTMERTKYIREILFTLISIAIIVIGLFVSITIEIEGYQEISDLIYNLSLIILILSMVGILMNPSSSSSYLFYALPVIILSNIIVCNGDGNNIGSVYGIRVLNIVSMVFLSVHSLVNINKITRKMYSKTKRTKKTNTRYVNAVKDPIDFLNTALASNKYKGGYRGYNTGKQGGYGYEY